MPAHIDKKVQLLAKAQKSSSNKMLENLIEAGLEAKEAERRRFFELAERLRAADNPKDIQEMKTELARMIFGA